MPTEAPSWPDADAAAELLLGDLNPGWIVVPIWVGAVLIIAFQLAYLCVGLYQVPAAARVTVPFHALNLLLAVVLLGATYAEVFTAHWRALVLWICCTLMVSSTFIGLADNQPDPLFVSVLLFMIGTGLLVPWGWRWQAALEVAGTACLVIASLTIGLNVYFWITLATTIALAHLIHEVGQRDRARILQSIQSQVSIQAALRNKIAELERAERRAGASEEMARRIIATSPDVITINRLSDGTYVQVNREFESTGFQVAESVGRSAQQISIWADRAQMQEFMAKLNERKRVRNYSANFRRKDGRIVPCLISGVIIELNEEPCIVSFTRDISKFSETERKLRESEGMLRKIFETSPDVITINRLSDGAYMTTNNGFAQTTGFASGEVLGKSPAALGIWADRKQARAFAERVSSESIVRSMEMDLRHKDGRILPHLLSAVVTEIGGEPCVITIGRNIHSIKETELELRAVREQLLQQVEAFRASEGRLRAEAVEREQVIAERELTAAKLRESEMALRQLFDQNLDSMTIIDLETGRYIDVNEEHIRNSDYSREEIVGQRSREHRSFENPEENARLVAELKRVGVVRNLEATFRRKDGSTYFGLISALNLKFRGHLCCISITRDIAALKETQRQLIAAREAALAAARAKSEFLSSMSHEIRTPMNAVLGMAELLANCTLTDEQRRWVNVMRSNGDALIDLINDMLDLAKIESGRLSIERIAFDLEELIDKLGDMLGVRAHQKGLELAMRIAPDVPRNLVGDPLRLRQILINLLGNAVKFTDRGQIVLSVERADIVAAGRPDPDQIGLLFSIRDTGIGIPKDKLSIIFSSFGQADSSTTRRYGGSGLGLAIARRLVELYGGEITVESEPGVGSCFSFVAMFGAGRAVETRAGAAHVNLRDVKTLIVDDTDVNRLILREILEPAGARVTEAPSGADALEEFERASATGHRFELILLDCRMPGMDGIELAARIREFYAKSGAPPPVVMMLTSDEMSVRLPQLCELGLNAYLVKPIRRAELLEAISRAMGDAEAVAESAVRPPAAEVTGALGRLRILLADDSSDNRLLVREFLSKTGCQFDEAENGREAFARFTTGNYDLVLMDMRMPVMDGLEATRAIRRWENENRGRRTPIIALTASALPDAVSECLDAGCDTHVSKPVKRVTLINAIRAAADADTTAVGPRVAD